jgi:hypothetical protein
VDSFLQAIGSGITGLVSGSFAVIGQTLRGMVDAMDRALPGGVLAVAAWQLAKR